MEIGKHIKDGRLELNMTQDDLAKKLNVGRSTISNWEIGRNYPDLQLIVSISEVLNIPLDVLLRKESDIVKEITKDTNIRESQSMKIKILFAIIIFLILIGGFFLYKNNQYKDITSPDQIASAKISGEQIEVNTDLPFYRSVSGYMIDNLQKGDDTVRISLFTQIDLSMKNKQAITIDLIDSEEDISINDIKKIEFIDTNDVFKSLDLK